MTLRISRINDAVTDVLDHAQSVANMDVDDDARNAIVVREYNLGRQRPFYGVVGATGPTSGPTNVKV